MSDFDRHITSIKRNSRLQSTTRRKRIPTAEGEPPMKGLTKGPGFLRGLKNFYGGGLSKANKNKNTLTDPAAAAINARKGYKNLE